VDISELVSNFQDSLNDHLGQDTPLESGVVPALTALVTGIEEQQRLSRGILVMRTWMCLQEAVGEAARQVIAAGTDAGLVAMAAFVAGMDLGEDAAAEQAAQPNENEGAA